MNQKHRGRRNFPLQIYLKKSWNYWKKLLYFILIYFSFEENVLLATPLMFTSIRKLLLIIAHICTHTTFITDLISRSRF